VPSWAIVSDWVLVALGAWLLALLFVWSLLRTAADADRTAAAAARERAGAAPAERLVAGRWEGLQAQVGDRLALALALVHSAASEVEPATPAARQLRDAEATLGRARALVVSHDG